MISIAPVEGVLGYLDQNQLTDHFANLDSFYKSIPYGTATYVNGLTGFQRYNEKVIHSGTTSTFQPTVSSLVAYKCALSSFSMDLGYRLLRANLSDGRNSWCLYHDGNAPNAVVYFQETSTSPLRKINMSVSFTAQINSLICSGIDSFKILDTVNIEGSLITPNYVSKQVNANSIIPAHYKLIGTSGTSIYQFNFNFEWGPFSADVKYATNVSSTYIGGSITFNPPSIMTSIPLNISTWVTIVIDKGGYTYIMYLEVVI